MGLLYLSCITRFEAGKHWHRSWCKISSCLGIGQQKSTRGIIWLRLALVGLPGLNYILSTFPKWKQFGAFVDSLFNPTEKVLLKLLFFLDLWGIYHVPSRIKSFESLKDISKCQEGHPSPRNLLRETVTKVIMKHYVKFLYEYTDLESKNVRISSFRTLSHIYRLLSCFNVSLILLSLNWRVHIFKGKMCESYTIFW